jgi:hypothetical protein
VFHRQAIRCPASLALSLLVASASFAAVGCAESSSRPGASPAAERGSQPNGETRIERFGFEATGHTRRAIVAAFEADLNALGDGDSGEVCSLLSTKARAGIRRVGAGAAKGAGCAAILNALLAPSAAILAQREAEGDVERVRVQGGRAFVVFKAPGAKLYQLTMVRERNGWRAATVIPSMLVPSAASLGR